MSNHDVPETHAVSVAADPEVAQSYCCECGTYDAHKARCLCCGFDFRTAPEMEASEAD